MGREWKPGDVAMVGVPTKTTPGAQAHVQGNTEVAVVKARQGWLALEDTDYFWSDDYSFFNGEIRPLVVIDPEDTKQVGLLCAALDKQSGFGNWIGETQAALREFANPTPPKPDEPIGLGAVVVDSDARIWIHDPTTPTTHNWHSRGVGRAWHNVGAVRVLSDGFVVAEPLADWERDLLRGDA